MTAALSDCDPSAVETPHTDNACAACQADWQTQWCSCTKNNNTRNTFSYLGINELAARQNTGDRGTLRQCLEFWKAIGAPQRVIRYIENGFAPDWNELGPPPAFDIRSGVRLTVAEMAFLDGEIEKMITGGCIRRCTTTPHCISPVFCVPKGDPGSGKMRKIFDLRRLNEHVRPERFKLETLQRSRHLIHRGDYCVGLDLTAAFWSVSVSDETSRYLAFRHRDVLYEYKRLPFGARFSPVIFDLLTLPLRRRWRRRGWRVCMYVDDISIFARTAAAAATIRDAIIEDLQNAGFTVNFEKSQLEPTQTLRALGWIIDTKEHRFVALEDRQQRITTMLMETATAQVVDVRELAAVAGKVASLGLALGRKARLLTRSMFRAMKLRKHRKDCGGHDCTSACWRGSVPVSEEVRRDANTLAGILEGEPVWGPIDPPPWLAMAYGGITRGVIEGSVRSVFEAVAAVHELDPEHTGPVAAAATDAGDEGCGGWLLEEGSTPHHRFFSEAEAERSSTHREAQGIEFVVRAVAEQCEDHTLYLATDNLGAAYILGETGGSPDEELAEIARSVFTVCLEHRIDLRVVHVPRGINMEADAIAGFEDNGEWRLTQECFDGIEQWTGRAFTLDLFASAWSRRGGLPFHSRWGGEGSHGDAFAADNLQNEFALVHPPPSLLARTLALLEQEEAEAVVIVPSTPRHRNAAWWAMLFPTSAHGDEERASCVRRVRRLPVSRRCLEAPAAGDGSANCPSYQCMAVHINCKTGLLGTA